MFNIDLQIASIMDRLATIPGVNQIDYADLDSDLDSRPRVLPSVSLLSPAGKPKDPNNKIITAENSWTVIIAARKFTGTQSHSVLLDSVCDALSGFQPEGAIRPMVPTSWGPLSERLSDGVFLSQVTFSTEQRATIQWDVRQIQ